jgi:predicted phosphodiesterase
MLGSGNGSGGAGFTKEILLVISDIHSFYVDKRFFQLVLDFLKENLSEVTFVIINGDLLDFPLLSKHIKKLYHKVPDEIEEIEFVKREILAPIREHNSYTRIIYKPGNHEERLTAPKIYSNGNAERIACIHKHYNTGSISDMLELTKYRIEYDEAPVTLLNDVHFLHGASVSKYAGDKNITDFCFNGVTGHTHRLSMRLKTVYYKTLFWMETGCLCDIKKIDYLPTAKVADWQNGFGVIELYKKKNKVVYISPTIKTFL